MRRLLTAVLLLAVTGLAHAYGLPWAVDSLEKARAQVKQNDARHLLVFYTSPT